MCQSQRLLYLSHTRYPALNYKDIIATLALLYLALRKIHRLRTPVRKYREFRDSTKKSNFFLFFQKVPFDELFSKKNAKGPARFIF